MTFHIPRRARVAFAATAFVVTAPLALASCSQPASTTPSTSGGRGGTLTIAANYGPTSLDPALQSVDPVNNQYIYPIYDYLTRLGADGKAEPDLATSWKYTDTTNTTFQLKLRDGVKFADGTALTAAAVVASLNYSR